MIFQYDGTYEGFLCTVFEIYAMHLANDAQIHPADGCLTLEESRTVENQSGKADRVSQRLKQLGIASCIYDAWLSRKPDIENDLFAVIRLAIETGCSPMQARQRTCVRNVAAAAHLVRCETHRFLQFTRFVKVEREPEKPGLQVPGETKPGIYLADIEPAYDILLRIAPHFVRRFQDQCFIIRDQPRGQALVYDAHHWQIVSFPELMALPLRRDSQIESLWRQYFDTVAIPWRKNRKLQQHFVPLQYRRYLTEFQPHESK